MKACILLHLVAVAALGWWLASPGRMSELPDANQARASQPPTTVSSSPAEVFQKAFWKRPGSDDRIANAERREWKDAGGISKWQWFITVKPSKALVNHLITGNAFMLARGKNLARAANAPMWFPTSAEDAEVLTNASGTFIVLWDPKQNLIHATDSGHGFTAGASAPAYAPAVVQHTPTGRLPVTPPPRP